MKKKVSLLADYAQIFSFILQLLGFIISILTAGFLSIQSEIIIIEPLNFRLGKWYQILLVICAFLFYLQLLRWHWERNIEKNDYSSRFGLFLLSDMLKTKQIFLIGFVLIFGTLIYISYWTIPFIIFFFTMVSSINKLEYQINNNIWEESPEYKEKWILRINSILDKNGYAETEDFRQLGLDELSYDEINFNLMKYFELHESNSNLSITPLEKLFTNKYGTTFYSRRIDKNNHFKEKKKV